MKILALETATIACSVALDTGREVLLRHQLAPREHAALLLPWVEELLGEAGFALNQLDAIAFGRGPGSFTSLRLGIGVVQGLAFGAGLGVVGISSLAALAQSALARHQSNNFVVATDARMQQVFSGCFKLDEAHKVRLTGTESVCGPEDIPMPETGSWFGLGNGFSVYPQILQDRMGERFGGYDADCWPQADGIIHLAEAEVTRGKLLPPEQALPHYLRDKVATQKNTG